MRCPGLSPLSMQIHRHCRQERWPPPAPVARPAPPQRGKTKILHKNNLLTILTQVQWRETCCQAPSLGPEAGAGAPLRSPAAAKARPLRRVERRAGRPKKARDRFPEFAGAGWRFGAGGRFTPGEGCQWQTPGKDGILFWTPCGGRRSHVARVQPRRGSPS